MAGPAHLRTNGPTALHPDQHHAVILHVKRLLGVERPLAPVRFSQPARAELGKGLRGNRLDVELSEQVKAGVQDVHAKIGQATSAGVLLLSEPGSDARNVAAPQPKTAGMVNLAQVPAVDHRLGHLGVAVESQVLAPPPTLPAL